MTTRFLKLISIAAILLVCFSLTGRVSASGSENKTVVIYGSIGLSDPNGDLAVGADLGFYGLTRLGLIMSQRIEVTFGVDYHSFGLDASENIAYSGHKFRAILFNGGLKINPGEIEAEVIPFLIVGVGIALVDLSDTLSTFDFRGVIINADSDVRPYIEFGGGFEFGQIQIWTKFSNLSVHGSNVSFMSFGIGGKIYLL